MEGGNPTPHTGLDIRQVQLLGGPVILLRTFAVLWRVLSDFFEKGYGYHAAALSYSAFMTLNAAVVFIGTILKYIPSKELIIKKLYEVFPNVSQEVVDLIVKSVENLSVQTQILTLLLVVFFIGNFLRTLEVAFSHIADTKPRPIPWVNYILPFLFGFLMLFYGFLDVIFGTILHLLENLSFVYPLAVKFFLTFKGILDYLAFPIGLFIIYWLLSPVGIRKRITLIVSFAVALLLSPLKGIFTWYATHFLVKNIILTPFAGVLILLIWIYTVSIFILLGYRAILFFQNLLYTPQRG